MLGMLVAVGGARRVIEVTVIVIARRRARHVADRRRRHRHDRRERHRLRLRRLPDRARLLHAAHARAGGRRPRRAAVRRRAGLGPRAEAGVSWEDHLFGGIGGILAARLLTPAARRRDAGAPRAAAAAGARRRASGLTTRGPVALRRGA